MPSVTVRYFAQLREQRGLDDEVVAFEPGTTVHALYTRLFAHTSVEHLPVSYARNATTVPADEQVEDGDEVVFLPPVGGG